MKFQILRETFLNPLQKVIGAVERRQTLPILGNVLIRAEDDRLTLTATDLEVELRASIQAHIDVDGAVTVPARKLFDICRNLPDESEIRIELHDDRLSLQTSRSRFTLSTLPANDFPSVGELNSGHQFSLPQKQLKSLIGHTAFAMAQQDVRYYLNGLLLEHGEGHLRTVATDGHRLALCESPNSAGDGEKIQVIVPRKGINELQRLLDDSETDVRITLDSNHIRAELDDLLFTSKLIDGRFPDYERVIPLAGDKQLSVDRQAFRQALVRASILSNEKYKGVRLTLKDGSLAIQAHNPEQEEAQEDLEIDYTQDPLEIGFNVNYMLDVIGVLEGENLNATFRDGNSSCLIEESNEVNSRYVIMPMRL